jgi:hypothetical protein
VIPGLLADSARRLEWWSTTETGRKPEPLRVNQDPSAPDFYDYAATDWFVNTLRGLGPTMSGPFVDHLCTNKYTITLSVPILLDGEFAGAAAADLIVSKLERKVMPELLRIDAPVALITGEGRVIASNRPDVLSGDRLELKRRALSTTPDGGPLGALRIVEL